MLSNCGQPEVHILDYKIFWHGEFIVCAAQKHSLITLHKYVCHITLYPILNKNFLRTPHI